MTKVTGPLDLQVFSLKFWLDWDSNPWLASNESACPLARSLVTLITIDLRNASLSHITSLQNMFYDITKNLIKSLRVFLAHLNLAITTFNALHIYELCLARLPIRTEMKLWKGSCRLLGD